MAITPVKSIYFSDPGDAPKLLRIVGNQEKFWEATTLTSLAEGLKMGFQQAFGLVLVEFFVGIFDEINDWSKNRNAKSSMVDEVKPRLIRIADQCERKLHHVLAAFKQGSLSGFFSNLVVTLINIFATTSRRAVRMVREGLFSLLHSFKILFCPPEDLSFREAAHEASKILLAGSILIGSMPIEEWLEKQLLMIPLLTGIAPAISTAIVGGLTVFITAFGVFLIDHLDILSVVQKQRNNAVHKQLTTLIQEREKCLEVILVSDTYCS